MRVLGRKKCTLVRTFFVLRATLDLIAFATLEAFLEPLDLPSGASSAAFLGMAAIGFGGVLNAPRTLA